jgi:hypothetical protein
MAERKRRWPKVLGGFFVLLALLVLGGWQWLKHRARQRVIHGDTVSAAEIQTELHRIEALGLALPDGGVVLEHPFAQPFSGRSFNVPQSWMAPMMNERLDDRPLKAKDVAADVELLEAAMSRQYGGWDILAGRGFSWSAFFIRWREGLRARGDGELSRDEAFAPMRELSQQMLDNHTQIPIAGEGMHSLSRSWVLEKQPPAKCTEVTRADGTTRALIAGDAGEQPRQARRPNAAGSALESVWYIALPGRDGELTSISCGEKISLKRTGPETDISIPRAIWGELTAQPDVKRLDDSTVVFTLPDMSPGPYRNVKKLKETWPKPNGHEKVLLVDLRNNGGGADDFGWEVLKEFVDRERTAKKWNITRAKSCLYSGFRWNFLTGFNRGVGKLDPDDLKDFQEELDVVAVPAEPDCARRLEREEGFTLLQHHPVAPESGPLIIVWTAAGCGSDCEALTMSLASLPGTWLVGTNTGGVAQFTQPGYGVLPHTGLQFRFALGTSDIYGDGRSVDGHGLDVDVLLAPDDGWTAERIVKLAPLLK